REVDTLRNPPASQLPPPPADPMAKITRKMGDTTAVYSVPMPELQKMEAALRAKQYSSPYAADIADAGRTIAREQAEIAGGDTRTGFFGIGRSRQGVIDGARR